MSYSLLNAGLTPKMKPLSAKKLRLICVLDIGTSKIACMIARLKPTDHSEALPSRSHKIEMLGFGHAQSKGIKSGVVHNMDEAEAAIRLAVSEAETQADMQAEGVILAVSSGRMNSEGWFASIKTSSGKVEDSDLYRLMQAASEHSVTDGRAVLHSLPAHFTLDKERGISEPRGMLGKQLGVDMHMITMDANAARNLMLCVERTHLTVEAMVAAPYASALATLTDDEAEIGTICIDFGAGTTTCSVYAEGRLIHADSLAIGGRHITTDLARGLSLKLSEAERVKVLHGGVVVCKSDERDILPIKTIGNDEHDLPAFITRADVIEIIRPRVDEILELVAQRLNALPDILASAKHVVITGGGAQLTGLAELTANALQRPVRLGRPMGVSGLPAKAKSAQFSALVGLTVYPQMAGLEHFEVQTPAYKMTGTNGYVARTFNWIKESF